MKTLNAFILACFKSALIGFAGIIIGLCIWESGTDSKLPPFIGMNLINLFVCFVYGLVFLLPLGMLQTNQIRSNDLVWSFKRYLPFITIAPSAIFLLIFFNAPDSHGVPDPRMEYDLLLAIPALLLCQQSIGLWQFLKTIKKQGE